MFTVPASTLAARIARTALIVGAFVALFLLNFERGLPLDGGWNSIRVLAAIGSVLVAVTIEARSEYQWWMARKFVWIGYGVICAPFVLWQWVAILIRQALAVVSGS